MSFNSLGLSKSLLKVLKESGYETPTPIQNEAIPPILDGRDVLGAAKTGTGKTAAFTLPILEILLHGQAVKSNRVRVLILTPTRELAAQVQQCADTYGKYVPVRSNVVYGGVKINPQMMKLRRGIDILVATPGRLLDLYRQNAIKFDDLEVFVLDEADRMLDMGFISDVRKILSLLPKRRQNLLFSATFTNEIRDLAKTILHDPVEITIEAENRTATEIEQCVISVDKMHKRKVLAHLIQKYKWKQVLVFTKTKRGANKVARQLNAKNISAAAIHGEKSQGARTKALAGFKDGTFRVLVATDIVARGLDIKELPQVVNFDLPHVTEDYVHRIGRTGRAGATGHAYSLVCLDDFKNLCEIERFIQFQIPRKVIEGYEPIEELPDSPKLLPPKRKKPKKKKTVAVRVEHMDDQSTPAPKKKRSKRSSSEVDRNTQRNKRGRESGSALNPVLNKPMKSFAGSYKKVAGDGQQSTVKRGTGGLGTPKRSKNVRSFFRK